MCQHYSSIKASPGLIPRAFFVLYKEKRLLKEKCTDYTISYIYGNTDIIGIRYQTSESV